MAVLGIDFDVEFLILQGMLAFRYVKEKLNG